ncbi:MAG: DUF4861 family protein [Chitinophagaceae bacterium]
MKYCAFLGLLFIVAGSSAQWKIKVQNPSNIERRDELVEIPRDRLAKGLKKNLPNDQPLSVLSNGRESVCQKLDKDGDGNWETLAFVADFAAKEHNTFTIEPMKAAATDVVSFAHARMKTKIADTDSFGASVPFIEMPPHNPPTDFSKNPLPPYLTEGPALENDKNAFRLYFDTRNTKDIYGKRQPRLVMDSVGSNTLHSYHNLSDWGMDILHVEKSLGAGSLALWTRDPNGKDTLVRLGGKDVVKETYKLLNDGPLYASFLMDYTWNVFGKEVVVKEVAAIWKGQYFYESNVTLSGAPDGSVLVSGIADFYENKMDSLKNNAVTTLYSYGKQSEHKDLLGMAIMAPATDVAFLKDAPKSNSDITRSHLLGVTVNVRQPNQFRFYSCWQLTDTKIVSSESDFRMFLEKEMEKYAHPLRVSL